MFERAIIAEMRQNRHVKMPTTLP